MPHDAFSTDWPELGPGLTMLEATEVARLRSLEMKIAEHGRLPTTKVVRAPSVIPVQVLERAGYVAAFPELLGAVRSFRGDRRAYRGLLRRWREGGDWTDELSGTGLALTSAACHSVYACLQGRNVSDSQFEVLANCFRNEQQSGFGRLRCFTMMEYVCLGSAEAVSAFVVDWRIAAPRFFQIELGLHVEAELAEDSFFGVAPSAASADDAPPRKIEFVWTGPSGRMALASVNYHGTHFGTAFDLSSNGTSAYSACMGFGLERILLAAGSSPAAGDLAGPISETARPTHGTS
jgi:hypothetical protein